MLQLFEMQLEVHGTVDPLTVGKENVILCRRYIGLSYNTNDLKIRRVRSHQRE
ncbi:hypothetical protein HanIR_Chr16g0814101 [Helianthus annuus]|nr:hypothetical protein HanIR_Chr16g0814101 [Helianthus annuus]